MVSDNAMNCILESSFKFIQRNTRYWAGLENDNIKNVWCIILWHLAEKTSQCASKKEKKEYKLTKTEIKIIHAFAKGG